MHTARLYLLRAKAQVHSTGMQELHTPLIAYVRSKQHVEVLISLCCLFRRSQVYAKPWHKSHLRDCYVLCRHPILRVIAQAE